MRGDPDFEALLADAAAGRDRALAAFREAAASASWDGRPTVESAAPGRTMKTMARPQGQGGDHPPIEDGAAGLRAAMGTDVGSPDGVPPQ